MRFKLSSSGTNTTSTACIYKTLQVTSPHYNKLTIKRRRIFLMSPLKCKNNPFFEGLPNVSDDIKFFSDELFSL